MLSLRQIHGAQRNALKRIALHHVICAVQLAVYALIYSVLTVDLLFTVNRQRYTAAFFRQRGYRNIVKLRGRNLKLKRHLIIRFYRYISVAAVFLTV